MLKSLGRYFRDKGQALIEYTMLVGLLALVAIAHAASIADQIMDIWADFFEKFGAINDNVSIPDNNIPEINMSAGVYRDEHAAEMPDPLH